MATINVVAEEKVVNHWWESASIKQSQNIYKANQL